MRHRRNFPNSYQASFHSFPQLLLVAHGVHLYSKQPLFSELHFSKQDVFPPPLLSSTCSSRYPKQKVQKPSKREFKSPLVMSVWNLFFWRRRRGELVSFLWVTYRAEKPCGANTAVEGEKAEITCRRAHWLVDLLPSAETWMIWKHLPLHSP